jgi:hypothetical protein
MWILLACAEPEPVVIEGSVAEVVLELVNPTSCSACDPLAGVDTLQLDVISGATVVASETWAWPDEAPVLAGLDGFGVVRLVLYGRIGEEVYSVGRTPELTLGPGDDRRVAITFLPANRVLPVTAGMVAQRSRHVAWRRRDGQVILFGGADPTRARAFESSETWDPELGVFGPAAAVLPVAVAAPTVDPQEDGTLFLTGGTTLSPDGEGSTAATAVYDDTADLVTRAGDMAWPRAGHCISRYLDRQGMVFGGTQETIQGDYFKVDTSTQTWAFDGVPMLDFDPGQVAGCITLESGDTFVQGRTAETTGVWAFHEEALSTGTAGDAFSALPGAEGREGAALRRLDDGRVWIVGGVPEGDPLPTEGTRVYDPVEQRFAEGPTLGAAWVGAQVEPWIAAGWYAVGCGWADAAREAPGETIQLLDPETGEEAGELPLDRERDGCTMTTLRDGAILVTGGFGRDVDDGADAAILVPWFGVTGDATVP